MFLATEFVYTIQNFQMQKNMKYGLLFPEKIFIKNMILLWVQEALFFYLSAILVVLLQMRNTMQVTSRQNLRQGTMHAIQQSFLHDKTMQKYCLALPPHRLKRITMP